MVGIGLGVPACSSSDGRRDMNYGTDVAVGFVPPDGPSTVSDAAADASLDEKPADQAADETEGAGDAAAGLDGAAGPDVSADESD